MSNEKRVFIKGDVYYHVKQEEYSIRAIKRPIIIVSSILINDNSEFVNAICIADNETKKLPTHVKIKIGNKCEGYAICENIIRIPKECITDFIGSVSAKELSEIDKRLCISLELNSNLKTNNDFIKNYEKEYKKSEKKEEELIKRKIEKECKERLKTATSEFTEPLELKISELSRELEEEKAKQEKTTKKHEQELNNLNQVHIREVAELKKEHEKDIKNYDEKLKSIVMVNADAKDLESRNKELESLLVQKELEVKNLKNMSLGIDEETAKQYEKQITQLREQIKSLFTEDDVQKRVDAEIKKVKQSNFSDDSSVELEVVTLERDMYKNKYIELMKQVKGTR